MRVKLYINKETNIPEAVKLEFVGKRSHFTADIRNMNFTLPFGKLECCISNSTELNPIREDKNGKSLHACVQESVHPVYGHLYAIEFCLPEPTFQGNVIIQSVEIEHPILKLLKDK